MLYIVEANNAKDAAKGGCEIKGEMVVAGEGTSEPKMVDGKPKPGTGGKAFAKGRLTLNAADGRTFACGFAAFEAKGTASAAKPVKPLSL